MKKKRYFSLPPLRPSLLRPGMATVDFAVKRVSPEMNYGANKVLGRLDSNYFKIFVPSFYVPQLSKVTQVLQTSRFNQAAAYIQDQRSKQTSLHVNKA